MTLIQQTFKKTDFAGGKRKKLPIFFASLISSPIILRISLAYQFLVQKKNSNSHGPRPQPPVQNPTPASRPRPSLEKRKEQSVRFPSSTLED